MSNTGESFLSTSPPYSQPIIEYVNNFPNTPEPYNYPNYNYQYSQPFSQPVSQPVMGSPARFDSYDKPIPIELIDEESSLFFNSAPIADPDKIPNAYRIQWNFFAGKLNGSESFDGHATYRFQLFYIDEIFKGETQKWNREYHNAVKIFGPALSAYAIRATISVQYRALYTRSASAKVDEGYVRSADAFLDVINYGREKKGAVKFYTYVIYKDSWRFSQTGSQFVQDMVSKHAVHANRSGEVIYAGEFFIYPEGDRHIVVIDNNSGTYSPDKALLPKVVLLLQKNFPGLEVIALDFNSSELQQYKENAKQMGKFKTELLQFI